MRATALALLIVSGLAAPARAEEACRWQDPERKPRAFVEDRVLAFRSYYSPEWAACVIKQGKRDVEVQFLVGDEIVDKQKAQLSAGKGEGPRQLEERLFPSNVCDKKLPPGKLAVHGRPGEQYVVQLQPVRVRVVASGELAPLAYTSPAVDFPCPACGSTSGSLFVRTDRDDKLVLEGEASRAWFECARREATLTLFGFAGQSQNDVRTAIRPDFVVEGLEKAFTREGDKYVLRKPLPMERLCGKAKVWSFEVWGRGQLPRMGGGGRSLHELRCR